MLNISYNGRGVGPYRLRRLSNGMFQIHVQNGPAFEGTRRKIFRAAYDLGVEAKELRLAIQEMNRHGHDYADFGIFGRFMWTGVDSKKKVA